MKPRRPLKSFLGALLGAAALLVGIASAPASRAEELEAGKATGAEIQAFRDAYVPQQYSPPAPGWIYADACVLTLLVASGTWLVLAGRPARWISVHLVAALVYFGLLRGGCVCPVGATSNVAIGLVRPALIGRAELAIFLVPLVAALIGGRTFCGAACPLGAVQHIVSPRRARPLERWLHRLLLALPIAVLFATVWSALAGPIFFVCRLDPYTPIFFQSHALVQKATSWITPQFAEPGIVIAGSRWAWLAVAVALLLGWLVPRIFCRYLCPYGVLLGALSLAAFRRRQIDPEACSRCGKCERECPVQAITVPAAPRRPEISAYQCIQCGRCSGVCPRGANPSMG